MKTLLAPSIFYCLIVVYVVCTIRNGGLITISRHFDSMKYYIGTIFYFFVNINILFYCSFCDHCHTICIPLTVSAVLIGTIVYLMHLGKQTKKAVRQIMAGEKFDLIPPFLAIPYFYLAYEIFNAIFNSGMESLHVFESKMMIVMLYPFFIAIGELAERIKENKSNTVQKKDK